MHDRPALEMKPRPWIGNTMRLSQKMEQLLVAAQQGISTRTALSQLYGISTEKEVNSARASLSRSVSRLKALGLMDRPNTDHRQRFELTKAGLQEAGRIKDEETIVSAKESGE